MLEDVPGLINPIIQAMIQTSKGQKDQQDLELRKEQLKQQADYQKAESAHAAATLAETQRQHDQMMQYNRDMLEKVHIPQIQALFEKQGIDTLAAKTNLRGMGVDLNQALPMGSGSSQGGPVDQNAGIPDQTAQQKAVLDELRQKAGIQAQAPIEAALSGPGQELFSREQQADQAKQQKTFDQQLLLEHARGADAQKLAEMREAAENSRTNTNGYFHLKGIALMHQLGLDPGDGSAANKAKTLLDGIYDGNTDPDKLSKDDKQLVTNYAAANGETVPTGQVFKSYKSTLDNASAVQAILSQARDAASKYSLDSPNSGSAGNKNMSLGPLGVRQPPFGTDTNGLLPGSEAKAAIDGLATTVGKFIPTLEGSQRQSDQNIARQLTGLINPKNTMEMNKKNINDKADLINQQLRTGTQGVNPDRLNVALQKRGIVDFGAQNTPKAYKDKDPTGTFGSNDGGQTMFRISDGKQVDPKTGVPIQ
jgi:hypothetical protein